MSDKNTEIRVKFEIGDIKFEAEGPADLVARERSIFTDKLLSSAVEAIERTRGITQYIESNIESTEPSPQPLVGEGEVKNAHFLPEQDLGEESLASFLKKYGPLSEENFILFSAYFDEKKNSTPYFTKKEVETYYNEARRTKAINISMPLNRLAKKGLIVDAIDSKQKSPKPYRVSNDGSEYIRTYKAKEKKQSKTPKARTNRVKTKSTYVDINYDELNLTKYPEVKKLKDFKEKMMLILYVITNENKGEWFTVNDVLYLMQDIFGESASIDQVNGVFNREKTWFKVENIEGNRKEVKRKLLNGGIKFAELLEDNKE